MPIHCHQNCNQMCLNMGYVVDGVVIRQKTDDAREDSFDCPQQRGCLRGRSLRQQVYNADRIKYPMKRKKGSPAAARPRTASCAARTNGSASAGTTRSPTSPTGPQARVRRARPGRRRVQRVALGSRAPMFPVIGGAVYDTETESFGCWAFQTEALRLYSHGDHPDLMMGPDKYDLPNADTIVLYGCNPAWAQHPSMYWLMNAKDAGVDFVYVGPSYNVTASALGAQVDPPRVPGTDTAFLLAVVHEMIRLDEERGDIIDWDFVNARTVGFTPENMPAEATTDENFRDYVLGAYDRAAEDAGVGERDLRHAGGGHRVVRRACGPEQQGDLLSQLRRVALPGRREPAAGVHDRVGPGRPLRQVRPRLGRHLHVGRRRLGLPPHPACGRRVRLRRQPRGSSRRHRAEPLHRGQLVLELASTRGRTSPPPRAPTTSARATIRPSCARTRPRTMRRARCP